MKLRKVFPPERFSMDRRGHPAAAIRLERSKYYRCPHCAARTLVRHREVSPFARNKTPADFDQATQDCFDRAGTTSDFSIAPERPLECYDFFCSGCKRPVRLLYEEQERGMGGFWAAVVYRIVEVA